MPRTQFDDPADCSLQRIEAVAPAHTMFDIAPGVGVLARPRSRVATVVTRTDEARSLSPGEFPSLLRPDCIPLSGRPSVAMVAACPFPASRGTPIRIEQMGAALHQVGCDVHTVTYHLGTDRPLSPMTLHRTRPLAGYQEFSAGPTYTKLFVLDPMLAWTLARVVRRHKIRVIHAHHFEGALCALLVKWLVGGVRVVYDAHTALQDELFHYRFRLPPSLKRAASSLLDSGIPRWCDHVICVSDELAGHVSRQGVPTRRISVIPMTVNTSEYLDLDPKTARRDLGIGDAPTVVYTGNLAPFQGVETLIRAMKKVTAERPDARLVIVGRPTTSCETMVQSLGLEDCVEFAGDHPFDRVRWYLAAADVVVLPRDRCPGFPLKLLNYMAAGKAIVAFAGGGRDVLRHLVNAFVAEDGSEDSFARGILECLRDRDLSTRMGRAALTTAQTFDSETMISNVQRLYGRLLPGIAPGTA